MNGADIINILRDLQDETLSTPQLLGSVRRIVVQN